MSDKHEKPDKKPDCKKPKQSFNHYIAESVPAKQQCKNTEQKGNAIIEKQKEQLAKNTIEKILKDIKEKIGIPIELDEFYAGMKATFKRNGTHIGIMAAKLRENPMLVLSIITKRTKEFAVDCADDPLKCAADIHGKAVDFVYNFMAKTDKERFNKFAYDMGQATAEAMLSLGTLGAINVARVAYLHPEIKDPEDYSVYFEKKIKPLLSQYVSPESQKQLDIFAKELLKKIDSFSLTKLQELFGAIEQFIKNYKKGALSTVNTMQTLNCIFLDITYARIGFFDFRPIIQDMISLTSKEKGSRAKKNPRYKEELKQKFFTSLTSFKLFNNFATILQAYTSLKDYPKQIPKRALIEKALKDFIAFRFDYCKDINNPDFIYMMEYLASDEFRTENPTIAKFLNV